jgi:hypothetical protein
MPVKQKQPSEEEFNQFKEELERRISRELLPKPSRPSSVTWFGRHEEAVLEFGKRLSEFKDSNEIIRVNNIGIGLEKEWIPPKMRFDYIPYEPLELLSQAAKILEPKQLIFYAADIEINGLFYLKSTKSIWMPAYKEKSKYFHNFFPGFHRIEGDTAIVDIPEEWRKRIVYLKLDILKQPAPVQTHITFSRIPDLVDKPKYFENLVASTRRGGYVFCSAMASEETLRKLNAEWVCSPTLYPGPGLLHLR